MRMRRTRLDIRKDIDTFPALATGHCAELVPKPETDIEVTLLADLPQSRYARGTSVLRGEITLTSTLDRGSRETLILACVGCGAGTFAIRSRGDSVSRAPWWYIVSVVLADM